MSAKNLELYNNAFRLRFAGASYGEINRELGVPKSTLAGWFANVGWSEDLKWKLDKITRDKNRKFLNKPISENIVLMNKARLKRMLARHTLYKQQAYQEYELLKNNSLFVAGLSLYWGEGDKRRSGCVGVINTDPDMMRIIMRFYRIILKVPEGKLRGSLFIYSDIDANIALTYWSDILRLPREQFSRTQVLPSRSSLTKRKVPHGMCSVHFASIEIHIKIMEWLKFLAVDMRE